MVFKQVSTGDVNTDKAIQNVYSILNSLNSDIKTLTSELSKYKDLSEKKFTVISDNLTTKKLIVGDVEGGNYATINEDGSITLTGTNKITINDGTIYFSNNGVLGRIRFASNVVYIERETSPNVWKECTNFF